MSGFTDRDGVIDFLGALLKQLYGDKGVASDASDADKLRALAAMLDRVDDMVERALDVVIDRDIQVDLRVLAYRLTPSQVADRAPGEIMEEWGK